MEEILRHPKYRNANNIRYIGWCKTSLISYYYDCYLGLKDHIGIEVRVTKIFFIAKGPPKYALPNLIPNQAFVCRCPHEL